MAKRVVDDASLTAVANAIRENAQGTLDGVTMLLSEMPGRLSEACAATGDARYSVGKVEGQSEGYNNGYRNGVADGVSSVESEIFFTQQGQMYRRNMVITSAGRNGFYQYAYRYADKMETISAPYHEAAWSSPSYVFDGCTALKTASLPKITRIGTQFFGNCTSLEEVTLGCVEVPMVSIAANSFNNCSALVRFNFVGVINYTVNFQWSPLNRISIESVINALDTTTTGLSVTLSLVAVNAAFETSEGAADGSTSAEWTELANTKSNWTINLV